MKGPILHVPKIFVEKIFAKLEVISVGVDVEDNSTLSWAF